MKDKFPKQSLYEKDTTIYQPSVLNNQAVSTTFTSYSTRTVTVHSSSGAPNAFLLI